MSRASHETDRELWSNLIGSSMFGLGDADFLPMLITGMATVVAVGLGLWWTMSARRRRGVQRKRVGVAGRQQVAGSTSDAAHSASSLQSFGSSSISHSSNEHIVLPNVVDSEDMLKEALGTPRRDPLEFCNHIQSQVKILMQKMARREVERQMTEEQRQRERAIQVSQLDAIFRLVEQQKSEYAAKGGSWDLLDSAQGENGSLPTAEGHFEAIREQMKMYLE